MENYQPNSHKFREQSKKADEKKKVEKVISGTAIVKKKSELRKFTDVFISEDASTVKSYILDDVVIPTAKRLISDLVKGTIDILLDGTTSRGRSSSTKVPYVSYDRFSSNSRDDHRYETRRDAYSPDNITLPTRADAEEVLDHMDNMIREYGHVAVADLYELVGIRGKYTDNKYGWTNLSGAEAVRTRDGYLLRLPRVRPI